MAKREAFTDGAVCWAGQVRDELRIGTDGTFVTLANIKADAHTKFPLPKVERPRVVTDPHAGGYEWRISTSGKAEWRCRSASEGSTAKEFHHPGAAVEVCAVTPERVAMWADLLSHPSEFVVDEG